MYRLTGPLARACYPDFSLNPESSAWEINIKNQYDTNRRAGDRMKDSSHCNRNWNRNEIMIESLNIVFAADHLDADLLALGRELEVAIKGQPSNLWGEATLSRRMDG